jgi:hypothetical protein
MADPFHSAGPVFIKAYHILGELVFDFEEVPEFPFDGFRVVPYGIGCLNIHFLALPGTDKIYFPVVMLAGKDLVSPAL